MAIALGKTPSTEYANELNKVSSTLFKINSFWIISVLIETPDAKNFQFFLMRYNCYIVILIFLKVSGLLKGECGLMFTNEDRETLEK